MSLFSHKENRKTKMQSPCVALDALTPLLGTWVEDVTQTQRLLVVSDSLLVQRLAEECSSLTDLITLSGDEAPATRKQRTRLWLNSPRTKLVVSSKEARRLAKEHPEAEGLAWEMPSSEKPSIKTTCQPMPFQILPLMPRLIKRYLEPNPTHRLIWIVDGVRHHERPQVGGVLHAQTAWQEQLTLHQLYRYEDALATGEVTLLCVDIHSLQALRLPTCDVAGEALQYHAVYESKRPCRAWQDLAGMRTWASFTRHPHEWWRWGV